MIKREKKARLIEHLMQIAEEGDLQALPEDTFPDQGKDKGLLHL
jgi:hypothetical protein